jgi:hypothetical protein
MWRAAQVLRGREFALSDEAISMQRWGLLTCTATPALAGGARERSAAQVSGEEQGRPRNDMEWI